MSMREFLTYGSVRGAGRKARPYRDTNYRRRAAGEIGIVSPSFRPPVFVGRRLESPEGASWK